MTEANIEAVAHECRGEADESGSMYFDRKAWGFFVSEMRGLALDAERHRAVRESRVIPSRATFRSAEEWDRYVDSLILMRERSRQVVTAGVDVANDRIEVAIAGWGEEA
ncbi:TPA: terminase gpA endonuclease subunit [Burkholderia contaminans]|uniref:terminase gpA endonuclease subunit n=1 Tax=Burkholderia contaminans TaxID=488447 RepID=UPI000D008015|nr:terminase gpA endonuclease subunit [Burkholderia contaminans]HDR9065493.1 hypothetical protein [Burkholderia vietnamiensis]MBM6427932.1 hypothetical protein [Burkholderia contaminans]MCA7876763.1 phage terminase large subunit family protein [Burkholderia contaminans]MDN8024214.1 hypothetical protein [Burkholderia contaminans]PRG12214.1 hypothetical protein C6Q17_14245 [Burkholderia contaminans]